MLLLLESGGSRTWQRHTFFKHLALAVLDFHAPNVLLVSFYVPELYRVVCKSDRGGGQKDKFREYERVGCMEKEKIHRPIDLGNRL